MNNERSGAKDSKALRQNHKLGLRSHHLDALVFI